MTYRCENCGAIFYEPERRHHRENLDGERGIWEYDYDVCPNCGGTEIEEVEDTEDA